MGRDRIGSSGCDSQGIVAGRGFQRDVVAGRVDVDRFDAGVGHVGAAGDSVVVDGSSTQVDRHVAARGVIQHVAAGRRVAAFDGQRHVVGSSAVDGERVVAVVTADDAAGDVVGQDLCVGQSGHCVVEGQAVNSGVADVDVVVAGDAVVDERVAATDRSPTVEGQAGVLRHAAERGGNQGEGGRPVVVHGAGDAARVGRCSRGVLELVVARRAADAERIVIGQLAHQLQVFRSTEEHGWQIGDAERIELDLATTSRGRFEDHRVQSAGLAVDDQRVAARRIAGVHGDRAGGRYDSGRQGRSVEIDVIAARQTVDHQIPFIIELVRGEPINGEQSGCAGENTAARAVRVVDRVVSAGAVDRQRQCRDVILNGFHTGEIDGL